MLAAVTGLAALLHASAVAFQAIKYAGVAYLLYMAWATLKQKGAFHVAADDAPRPDREVVLSAVLVNLLNPKLSIFFFAFLPQFVRVGEASPLLRMLELSLVFMAMTFAVFVVYGVFAASVRDHVVSRPRVLAWMRLAFATAFVALGARLAIAER
jgi:threonine/homoserine/homoserine lactone efflux protein